MGWPVAVDPFHCLVEDHHPLESVKAEHSDFGAPLCPRVVMEGKNCLHQSCVPVGSGDISMSFIPVELLQSCTTVGQVGWAGGGPGHLALCARALCDGGECGKGCSPVSQGPL